MLIVKRVWLCHLVPRRALRRAKWTGPRGAAQLPTQATQGVRTDGREAFLSRWFCVGGEMANRP